MPLISRTFIKAGMAFFVLSLVTGLITEINLAALPAMGPVFWHMLMVGWITQIIFGVSIWMFPGRNRKEGLKAQKWGWLTFIFLNGGLLRVISEPAVTISTSEIWRIVLTGSALLQLLAAITYLIEMWPRIISKKQQRKKRARSKKQDA